MSDPQGPPDKGPARVPVHYFQKKPRSLPPVPDELSATAETMPITKEDIDRVTQAAQPVPVTPRALAKPARGKSRKPAPAKASKRSRRTHTPVQVSTDPALWYHVEKMQELRAGAESPQKAVERERLADVALHGHKLFEQGKLDEARVVFEDLVARGVSDAFPHVMLGTIYLAQEHRDRALALFEAALAIDPEDIAARVYRAELRINAGKIKPALEDLFKALDLRPESDPFVQRARRLIAIAEKVKSRKKR